MKAERIEREEVHYHRSDQGADVGFQQNLSPDGYSMVGWPINKTAQLSPSPEKSPLLAGECGSIYQGTRRAGGLISLAALFLGSCCSLANKALTVSPNEFFLDMI